MLQLLQLKLGLETGVELQIFNDWLYRSRVNFFMLLWKGEFQNIDAECHYFRKAVKEASFERFAQVEWPIQLLACAVMARPWIQMASIL